MTKGKKLLRSARNHPHNLRFEELCRLAEACGFEWVHGTGSHRVYAREGVEEILDFQPRRDGKAKAYQVRQLLAVIGHYGLEP
jgi:predicted RNA binding protein YcfA (HicA-like mRNA interferase family)